MSGETLAQAVERLGCLMLRRCKHERVRCIHGDEIVARMSWWRGVIRRAACLDCGKALDRGLPDECWWVGGRH